MIIMVLKQDLLSFKVTTLTPVKGIIYIGRVVVLGSRDHTFN